MRIVSRMLLIVSLSLAVGVLVCFGQQAKHTDHHLITAKLFVLSAPENAYGPGVVPPDGSYQVITYIVTDTLEKDLNGTMIKVAYFGRSGGELKAGDEICASIRRTTQFRDFSRVIFHDLGYVISEEFLADFIFEKPSSECR